MIEYVVYALWDGIWYATDNWPEDHDTCPPQRILTEVLKKWLSEHNETDGTWKLMVYDSPGSTKVISQSVVTVVTSS